MTRQGAWPLSRYPPCCRRTKKALEIADGIARKDPTFPGHYFVRGVAYLQLGRYNDAENVWLQCIRLLADGCTPSIGHLGYIYAKQGRQAEASKLIDSLETLWQQQRADRRASSIATSLASAYAGLDQRDSAVTWLERAATLRTQMLYVKVDQTYAALRSEPRYQALLKRMGFPGG